MYVDEGFPSASHLRVTLSCTPTKYSVLNLTILGGSVHQFGKQNQIKKQHLHKYSFSKLSPIVKSTSKR